MLIRTLATLALLIPFQNAPQQPPAGQPEQAPPPATAPSQPAATPQPSTTPMTLGEFAVKAASTLKLTAPAGGFTPESAAWALVARGVKLRPELSSPLVEQDAITLLAGLGYKVRTTTPSRVMTQDRVNILIETFLTSAP